jgi:hypothetical protein
MYHTSIHEILCMKRTVFSLLLVVLPTYRYTACQLKMQEPRIHPTLITHTHIYHDSNFHPIYHHQFASFISTSAQTTSFGSNHCGSSQSSSLINELKLEVTTKFGTELSSSSSASFSDRDRFSCEFLVAMGELATVCTAESRVGKMVCLTLYPSATAIG